VSPEGGAWWAGPALGRASGARRRAGPGVHLRSRYVCDVLCVRGVATATGAALWAKNSDRPPDELQLLEWLPPRRDGGPVRATHISVAPAPAETLGVVGSRPWWGWGLEHGVNTAGVAAGNLGVYTTLDPRSHAPALTGMDLVRLALERATTATGAVEVIIDALERYGQGGSCHHGHDHPYWSSFVVADPAGAWVVDTSGQAWAVLAVDRSWASSNRTAIPNFDAAHRHPRQPVDRLVEPRLGASRAVLAAEPVTEAALAAHLRSHAGTDGYSVCMHVPGTEATTASMIAVLPPVGPPRVSCLIGSPCASVYVPLGVGPLGRMPSAGSTPGLGLTQGLGGASGLGGAPGAGPVRAGLGGAPGAGPVRGGLGGAPGTGLRPKEDSCAEPEGAAAASWLGSGSVSPADREALDAVEADLLGEVAAEPALLEDPAWPDEAWERAQVASRLATRPRR